MHSCTWITVFQIFQFAVINSTLIEKALINGTWIKNNSMNIYIITATYVKLARKPPRADEPNTLMQVP